MGNEDHNSPPSDQQGFVFPESGKYQRRSEDLSPSASKAVLLTTVSAAEARDIGSSLESHGIPCELLDASEDSSEDAQHCQIFVSKEHEESARRVMAGDYADELAREDEQFERDLEEIRVAKWICPKCKRSPIELMPHSKTWLIIRRYLVVVALLPLFIFLLRSIFPFTTDLLTFHDDLPALIWFAAVFVMLFFLILSSHGRKHCKLCGWAEGGGGV